MKHFIARVKNKLFRNRLMKKYGFFKLSFNSAQSVLMFHTVGEGNDKDEFNCEEQQFKEFILYLKENIGFIKPDDLFKTSKGLLLTFDDGTVDIFTDIYPFLKDEKIPFVVFVTLGYLGKEGYLNEKQLLELDKSDLCYIGAHSMSHPLLRFVNDSNFEISESVRKLENILKHKIDLFAYPYGSVYACSKKNINEAKNSGVLYAFSSIPGYLNKYVEDNKYFLPRFDGSDLIRKFINKEFEL